MSKHKIIREYREVIASYKGDNISYADVYKQMVKKAGCDTQDDEDVRVSIFEEIPDRTIETIRSGNLKTRCDIITLFWICVIFDATFEDSVLLFYAMEYNLDTLRDGYDILIQLLYYMSAFGYDYQQRYGRLKKIIAQYGL